VLDETHTNRPSEHPTTMDAFRTARKPLFTGYAGTVLLVSHESLVFLLFFSTTSSRHDCADGGGLPLGARKSRRALLDWKKRLADERTATLPRPKKTAKRAGKAGPRHAKNGVFSTPRSCFAQGLGFNQARELRTNAGAHQGAGMEQARSGCALADPAPSYSQGCRPKSRKKNNKTARTGMKPSTARTQPAGPLRAWRKLSRLMRDKGR